MKFMKLGTRPDTFFSRSEAIRLVASEVPTDLQIQVQNCFFHLHKFPLLSKCLLLQKLYSDQLRCPSEHGGVIQLPDVPGGAEAFEVCAKFCYGITITISPLNLVVVRCAAEYLQMTDGVDRGNLAGKLEVFFKSCILRRWKDTLVMLQTTRQLAAATEELGITGGCIDAIATSIIGNPWKKSDQKTNAKDWWAEDIAELGVDHYWRIMIIVKSAGVIPNRLVVEALKVYSFRWLSGNSLKEKSAKIRVLMEKIVSLLPNEQSSVSCKFLLKLLKAANAINSSASLKMDLARRIGLQLEEAIVDDLLIPPPWSPEAGGDMLYDVDLVKIILDEFMLSGVQSPPNSPPRKDLRQRERRQRSRSAENVEFEAQESSRRSSSGSHGSKLRVAKVIDGYLQEIARDANLPLGKFIALAEAIPDFARSNHDDLYGAIEVYLRSHPELGKNERKRLCRVLDCKKLSMEACMHAAQNELLPLRVVVQVLFFEQSRSAMSSELTSSIKALLAKTTSTTETTRREALVQQLQKNGGVAGTEDSWSISSKSKKVSTLRMKLEEDDNDLDADDQVVLPKALMRSSSSRLRAFCAIPSNPKKMFSKFLSMNRSFSERD